MAGDFDTLSEFARFKGFNTQNGIFIKNTNGWLKEKDKLRQQIHTKAYEYFRTDEAILMWSRSSKNGHFSKLLFSLNTLLNE